METNLGDRLRSARESAGISIDDAVYRAKFPRAVVEALEEEDFGFFTSPLYARSFLRQYGDYVGADVAEWIDDLVPAPMIDSDSVESMVETLDIADPVVTSKEPKFASGNIGFGNLLAAVWMIAITGGLIWGGITIYQKLDSQLSEITQPPPELIRTPPDDSKGVAETEVASEGDAADTSATTENTLERPKRAIIVNIPEEE